MPSDRRTFLLLAAGGSASLAGCSSVLGSPSPDQPPEAGVDELPDPETHAFGANGDWSSFGCNASNTRAVGDGKAPVDGVSERWRVEVTQTTYHAPVVANGLVFLLESLRTLRVFDAGDGSELWTLEGVNAVPVVRNGVAYVPVKKTMYALNAETGDQLWERAFERPGGVAGPSMAGGDRLLCGVGEHIVSLDPEDGSIQWERKLFGRVMNHPPYFSGYNVAVTTEAGIVYLLQASGTGLWQWDLPSPPTCPPTIDTDSIYVSCQNGETNALQVNSDRSSDVLWTADTGWAERGIATAGGLVFVANSRALTAVDADSGERRWEHDIGDWRHTAPAYGRDTVFVGGDRLYAFDPDPSSGLQSGPALRFDREFAGRVGPGPVLDDGVLYAVAEIEADTYALLALE
ncbi:PQQ-like beta-propeller repeat protein [Halostagnicola kamekurae]|uniref:Outer membrane protein assembly factor BamB, contains PQQ-like beta-propeller repeat n=1 Tax=Halostagnicola kamekurae TaxID=619731 RepID=A0A1I6UCZ2_9EURY|nr:PQQ-like beta-propeller repeat protein [Halostagnicola kamekurae]SFS99248.1 Outer membrane protein assembly factor BamB, contains PQQ-like beta-propeller repeat [Halostagnicola kamekurae]